MNILLTGATGYIGGHILQRLLRQGHDFRCLVRKTARLTFPKNISNIEMFYGDIAERNSLTGICKHIDIVINAAGILGKWNSSVQELRPVNTNGIVNLAEELVKSNVEYIIHLSAGGVSGPVKGPPADETYRCRPKTPYEITKWEGEKNALGLFRKYHLPIVVMRPTFTYGPEDPHKLPLFRRVKKGSFVFVGSGESTNHPVYIDDLVEGIILLLQKRPVGETFIIGGPRPVTKKELINAISENLGVNKEFLRIPRWVASFGAFSMVIFAKFFRFEPILTPSRVSMMADNWGYSIAKAKKKLGYEPKFHLKAGINKTVESYFRLGWL